MANQFLTTDLVTKEFAFRYKNVIRYARSLSMQYSDYFATADDDTGKIGSTLRVRKPPRWVVTEGQGFQDQAISEPYVTVPVDKQFNVGMSWSTAEQTTDISDQQSRYIDTAAQELANKVDNYTFGATFLDVWNAIGTPGTVPSSLLTYQNADVQIFNQSVPEELQRMAILSGKSMSTIASSNATLFNPSQKISKAYETAYQQNDSAGIAKWYKSQNVQPYTTGGWASGTSTPIVSGANQTGSSLLTTGWSSGQTTLRRGDTFTIANVYTMTPIGHSNTGELQSFVVTSDISDTTGTITIPIAPSIITSGPLQTVNASPAANAAITLRGASGTTTATMTPTVTVQNLLYVKDFATLVHVDLAMPNGGAVASRFSNPDWGISLRLARQWQGMTDQNATRIDVLVGAKTIDGGRACRIYS
jgi:hypothetical protein